MRICLDQLEERACGRVFDMSEIHGGPSSATSFFQSGHAYQRWFEASLDVYDFARVELQLKQ